MKKPLAELGEQFPDAERSDLNDVVLRAGGLIKAASVWAEQKRGPTK